MKEFETRLRVLWHLPLLVQRVGVVKVLTM